MQDEHAAFLDSIVSDAEDDIPRLIYADWLEEHGDPRGEFIRLQCQLANVVPGDEEMRELTDRQHELLMEHEAEWAASG